MLKKILIEASYPEEIKLILLDNEGKLEGFDYQNDHKKSIKGNIYLGKVNRIEPSLQAAFVDYGNERKGFLSLEMIHPRYYQIPVADKEKLIKEIKTTEIDYKTSKDISDIELLGDKEYLYKNKELYNSYKIQEVIKKDQILLVQVEKEERENKGAFLSTYISLSGRYCVFSPNSMKQSCGISKKLDDQEERDRLKSLSDELLKEHQNASMIFRTASAYRTKAEIKRDFNYLTAVWEKIKNSAISSYAPALIYEEGDLLINGIKKFYTSEVEKIIVSGHEAYQKIHEFLKFFTPKNIDKLQKYISLTPILYKYGVESQLQELYSNRVRLKSGGYLIINVTEALTSIDVNSGAYTEEYSIENTALNINLEATTEIAKQVKFRGLSGLIVIDFIDMLDPQNKKSVEKELKKAFWQDKGKVQVGRISEFGLLEMSRQRIGRSFIESNSANCLACSGRGKVILKSSTAILLMGKLKFLLSKKSSKYVNIFATTDVVTYLINTHKRELSLLEDSYNTQINLYIDDSIALEEYRIIFGKFRNVNIKNKRYKMPDNLALNDDHYKEEEPENFYEKKPYKPVQTPRTKNMLRKYRDDSTKQGKGQKKIVKGKHTSQQKDEVSNAPSVLKRIWKSMVD